MATDVSAENRLGSRRFRPASASVYHRNSERKVLKPKRLMRPASAAIIRKPMDYSRRRKSAKAKKTIPIGMPYAQRLAKKPFKFRPPGWRTQSAKRLLPKQNGRTFGFSTRQRRSASASRSRPTTAGISRPERPHTASFRSRETSNLSRELLNTNPETSSSNTASSVMSSHIQTDGHVGAAAGGGSATPTRATRPQSPELNMGKVFSIMRNLGIDDAVGEDIYTDAVKELLRLWEKATVPRWERYKKLKECAVSGDKKATLYRVIDNIDLVQQNIRAKTTLHAAIEQRQSYVLLLRSSLGRIHSHHRQVKGCKLVDILFTLRLCSLKVVESYLRWQRTLARPLPPMHHGDDYMLTMRSDLNFLFEGDNAAAMCAQGLVVPDSTLMQVAPGTHRLMLKAQHKDNHTDKRLEAARNVLINYSAQESTSPTGMTTTLIDIGSLPPGSLSNLTRKKVFDIAAAETASAAPTGDNRAQSQVVASFSVLGNLGGYCVVECSATDVRGDSAVHARVYRPAHPSAPDAALDVPVPYEECSVRVCEAVAKRLRVVENEEGIVLALATAVREVHVKIVRAIFRQPLAQSAASKSDISALIKPNDSAAVLSRLRKRKGKQKTKKISSRFLVRVCRLGREQDVLACTEPSIGSTKLPVWNCSVAFSVTKEEKLQLRLIEPARAKRPERLVAISNVDASAFMSTDTTFTWIKLHAPTTTTDTAAAANSHTTSASDGSGAVFNDLGDDFDEHDDEDEEEDEDDDDADQGVCDIVGEIQLQLHPHDEVPPAPDKKAVRDRSQRRVVVRGVRRGVGRRPTSSRRDWRQKQLMLARGGTRER